MQQKTLKRTMPMPVVPMPPVTFADQSKRMPASSPHKKMTLRRPR